MQALYCSVTGDKGKGLMEFKVNQLYVSVEFIASP